MSPLWLLLPVLGLLLFLGLWILTISRRDDGAKLPPPQVLEIRGQNIAVYRMGQGPQLVLLHGLATSAYSWRYVLDILKDEYEVIALDLIGFGESSRPLDCDYSLETQSQWLHDAICMLDIKPVALVGSSMGGLLSLWLSKTYPEAYKNVAALSPAALGRRGKPLAKIWYRSERLLPVFVNRWTVPWIVLGVVGSVHPLNRTSLKKYLRPNSVQAFLRSHQALCDSRLPEALAGLKARVLLLWGRFDLMVPRAVLRDLQQVLPQAKVVMLESAHHPHEHQPQVVAREIRQWLQTLDERKT